MSVAALVWAMEQDIRPALLKWLLVVCADVTPEEGLCYPSIPYLANLTCMDRKTVIDGMAELQARGFLLDTGKRAGRTRQIPVYRLQGMPTGERHYVYKLTRAESGEFYLGLRTCFGMPATDSYMGSGRWPDAMRRQGVLLTKQILSEHDERVVAHAAEKEAIKAAIHNPLCRNIRIHTPNSPVYGTVPFFPSNSPVFPMKQSRRRDTELQEELQDRTRVRHGPPSGPRASAAEALLEGLKAIYPKREGSQRWPEALKHLRARLLEDPAAAEAILAGAKRYVEFCRVKGIVGTDKVQQAATFTGALKGYLEPWAVHAGPARKTPADEPKDRLESDIRAAASTARKYGLRQQLVGEPSENFIARIDREFGEVLERANQAGRNAVLKALRAG